MIVNQTMLLDLGIAALLVFAALQDLATRTVSNWVSVAIVIAGFGLQGIAGNLPAAMIAGVVVFVASLLMWRQEWLGGADVKLLGAGAFSVSPESVGTFVLTVALTGGVLALIYLGLSLIVRRPAPGQRDGFPRRVLKAEAWRIHNRGPLPYAAAIAAGGFFTLFRG